MVCQALLACTALWSNHDHLAEVIQVRLTERVTVRSLVSTGARNHPTGRPSLVLGPDVSW